MTIPVHDRLQTFAAALLERHGALVDWPEHHDGLAILTPSLAKALDTPEEVRLSTESLPDPRTLSVNLASDFLERVEPLIAAAPAAASLRLDGLYLKKSPMDDPVARFFHFPNARVRVTATRPVRLAYHCWYFSAAIDSEDRWEDIVPLHINPLTRAAVPLPDPLAMVDALQCPDPFDNFPPDLDAARKAASLLAADRAAPFLAALEARLERDRRRIRDYYTALLDESSPVRSRTPQDPQKLADKHRAVEIERQRRLLELDERYALRLRLDPLALVALLIPALEIDLEVSRRPTTGITRVYWNPLRKELEPLACSHCSLNTTTLFFSPTLTPLCPTCAAANAAAPSVKS